MTGFLGASSRGHRGRREQTGIGGLHRLRGWGWRRASLGTQGSTKSAPEGPEQEVGAVVGHPRWEVSLLTPGEVSFLGPQRTLGRRRPTSTLLTEGGELHPISPPRSGKELGYPTAQIPTSGYTHRRFRRGCTMRVIIMNASLTLGFQRGQAPRRAIGRLLEHLREMGAWARWFWRGQM